MSAGLSAPAPLRFKMRAARSKTCASLQKSYSGVLPDQPNQEPAPPRVSAIVVSHNRAALLRRCLEALRGSEGRETIQVIVVDNGSTDGSPELEPQFPEFVFMRLPHNFGLTKALNIGIRSAKADYLLLLHDDAELPPEAVKELAGALDARPDVGAVCPLLVDPEGRPAPQIGDFPPDGVYEPAEDGKEPLEVDYATGAAFMFRTFFFRAMRIIDEQYGQFGGDAELCYRIRTGGKKILILPWVRAVHHGREGGAERREIDELVGATRFIAKHYGFAAGFKARAGAVLRAFFGLRMGEAMALISGEKIDGTQS
jgi:N-acetylglucosaminyl-diphospho-decaprenol L-rhamnosyltransferase